ncbi:MAG: hypothetical protein JRJ41_08020 [Deltaproteobacteria bacterium]|jgi:hypothetical protein|nr:hypothetical protein [Deltaproteobacteria bacterium]
MTKKRLAQSVFIILFLLYALPSLAGDVVFYDNKGKLIDKTEYEKIVDKRAQKIDKIMQDGYKDNTMKLEDPVLLRKKRIEQWEKYRKARRKFQT